MSTQFISRVEREGPTLGYDSSNTGKDSYKDLNHSVKGCNDIVHYVSIILIV